MPLADISHCAGLKERETKIEKNHCGDRADRPRFCWV